MQHELSQIEFHGGPISQTKTGFQLTNFTDIITRRQVAWQREGEKKRKQTGFALLFVVTWGCSGTSPQSRDSTRREEDVTWTPAVSADHLLSPSPSSLVTWSHPHGTWERSPCPLLSPDRMWDAVCTLLADIYKVIKAHSQQRWLNK